MTSVELVLVATERKRYKDADLNLPTYEVRLDGVPIGFVRRAMVSRERRTRGGRPLITSSWQSPGWFYGPDKWPSRTAPSRREGVERLLEDAGLPWGEAESLAAAAKVVPA